jgi:hypothetical protein
MAGKAFLVYPMLAERWPLIDSVSPWPVAEWAAGHGHGRSGRGSANGSAWPGSRRGVADGSLNYRVGHLVHSAPLSGLWPWPVGCLVAAASLVVPTATPVSDGEPVAVQTSASAWRTCWSQAWLLQRASNKAVKLATATLYCT